MTVAEDQSECSRSRDAVPSGAKGVAVGKDGHLFLAGGSHFVLDYLTGKRVVDPVAIRNFEENLQGRRAMAAEREIPYLHLVAPDKHSVMRHRFPFDIHVLLGEFVAARVNAAFLYPVAELQSFAGGETYWKTDSHWNLAGSVAASRAILLGLGFDDR